MIDSTDILFATTRPLPAHECRVIELRRYTLHAGRRETLIELFDREFVEAQEVVGISVIGQFRDLDDAGAFVWLRGFADMAARREGLAAFCGGPVWKAHREQANATMVSSDDVRLLRPAWPGAGIAAPRALRRRRPAAAARPARSQRVRVARAGVDGAACAGA